MTSEAIRSGFIRFFTEKKHSYVHSAPIVVKNDPTLMFTNAGMNQFKDIFLGNVKPASSRAANSQKCLRVSGKHNDLEEVGFDTYHHTMFEMLGNWSFGDYFKEEAIDWAWEYLTEVLKINKDQLYVTYFEGSEKEKLEADKEAAGIWKKFVAEDHIIPGSRKDNFWEMGETGPCGPCSEVHIDIRPEAERKKSSGRLLVNTGNSLVIEIWNLVFIQYNRNADGSLNALPQKHVDTGMGFERLCMVVQGKQSNYDTDVFRPLISEISSISGIAYGKSEKSDVAIRVIADHIRAVAFTIADGQLPSNTGAGYVIRRILRRAVRYGYTFLGLQEPFMNKLLPVLSAQMADFFPEIRKQESLIKSVIEEEELSFLRTLGNGIVRFEHYISRNPGMKTIPGSFAFELYDTFGFPIDLTQIMAREKGLEVDMADFGNHLEEQRKRSRSDAKVSAGDWVVIHEENHTDFVGYDCMATEARILKYRKTEQKGKAMFHLVLDKTPFYAEGGGQVGDTGIIRSEGRDYQVINTVKENNLTIHILNTLPGNPEIPVEARVNMHSRFSTQCNHSATHLLHYALREILGKHVEQKGSLVNADYLRFDFSHFKKTETEELEKIELLVNLLIVENIILDEHRELQIDKANEMGAIALFGEKYGEKVRVIKFGESVEFCGGTHVSNTSQIGLFKIISESSIASGIRRIEAVSGQGALHYIKQKEDLINNIAIALNHPPDILKNLKALQNENEKLKAELTIYEQQAALHLKEKVIQKTESVNGTGFAVVESDSPNAAVIKDVCWQLKAASKSLMLIVTSKTSEKITVHVLVSDDLVKKGMNAVAIVKELAALVKGGGGGQPFYATAGGSDLAGYEAMLVKAEELKQQLQ
jgi:alanyl-tRNA synthetase